MSRTLWLKADAGLTQGSGLVSAWADQSASALTVANTGTPPSYVSSFQNGLPGVQFVAASSTYLALRGNHPLFSSAFTMVFVVKAGSAATRWLFSHGVGNVAGIGLELDANHHWRIQRQGTSGDPDHGAADLTAPHVIACRAPNRTTYPDFRIDGVQIDAQGSGNWDQPDQTAVVGSWAAEIVVGAQDSVSGGTFSDFADCTFGEIMVYDGELTTADLNAIELSLGTKWNISVTSLAISVDGTVANASAAAKDATVGVAQNATSANASAAAADATTAVGAVSVSSAPANASAAGISATVLAAQSTTPATAAASGVDAATSVGSVATSSTPANATSSGVDASILLAQPTTPADVAATALDATTEVGAVSVSSSPANVTAQALDASSSGDFATATPADVTAAALDASTALGAASPSATPAAVTTSARDASTSVGASSAASTPASATAAGADGAIGLGAVSVGATPAAATATAIDATTTQVVRVSTTPANASAVAHDAAISLGPSAAFASPATVIALALDAFTAPPVRPRPWTLAATFTRLALGIEQTSLSLSASAPQLTLEATED